jgi:hypothetical protein
MIKWKMLPSAFCFSVTRELPLAQNFSFGCFNYVSSCLFIERDSHVPFPFCFSAARDHARETFQTATARR